MNKIRFYFKWMAMLSVLALSILLASCDSPGPAPAETTAPSASQGATPSNPVFTSTPFQPSPTPEALAARVDGSVISLADYQAELARYQSAAAATLTPEDEEKVLNDLIDQILLAEAARKEGFLLEAEELQARMDQLSAEAGGTEALENWMAANGYVAESFREELARSLAAAWMRDQIVASVPERAEQVQARQIYTKEPEQANEALSRLQAGANFATLAAEYDPVTEGELGWFPRGFLVHPALEEAAFQLEPGQYSDIIESEIGFHILYVIERDEQRLLDPDARLVLKEQVLNAWLEENRSQSSIEVLAP